MNNRRLGAAPGSIRTLETKKEVNLEDKLFIKDRVRTFLTKVFEGPFKDAGRWAREMKDYVKSKGKESKKMNLYYTTCPSCAKVYGKSHTVILAMV